MPISKGLIVDRRKVVHAFSKIISLFWTVAVMGSPLLGQFQSRSATNVHLEKRDALEVHSIRAEPLFYQERNAIHVTDNVPDKGDDVSRIALVKGTSIKNGVVELSVSGDTAANAPPEFRGFVGIAFRVAANGSSYECLYLRPKNGRSEDQLQRNHSTQYMSFPGFPWERLRHESPGKYESYVDLTPGAWTKLKITFNGAVAQLYVDGAAQPTLIVHDLRRPVQAGAIALWIGPGTVANFADLTVR